MLKLFVASVIILFGVLFFLFALFPSEIAVSRIVRINAPRDSVAGKIADLKTWAEWNTLLAGSGRPGNAVPGSADSSRLVSGNLSVLIIKKTPDTLLTQWRGLSGRSFLGRYVLTESNGQVILQCSLEFHLRWYPWEKLAGMFYDKQLGPAVEQSLLNLQKALEHP